MVHPSSGEIERPSSEKEQKADINLQKGALHQEDGVANPDHKLAAIRRQLEEQKRQMERMAQASKSSRAGSVAGSVHRSPAVSFRADSSVREEPMRIHLARLSESSNGSQRDNPWQIEKENLLAHIEEKAQKISYLEGLNKSHESSRADLQIQNNTLNREMAVLYEKLNEIQNKQSIDDSKRHVDEMEETISKLEEKVTMQAQQLKNIEDQNSILEKEIKKKSNATTDLEIAIKELEFQIEDLTERNCSLENRLKQEIAPEAVNEYQKYISQLQEDLDVSRREVESLNQILTEKARNWDSERVKLTEELSKLSVECEKVKKEKLNTDNLIATVKEEHDEKVAALLNELNLLKESLSSFESNVSQLEIEKAALSGEIQKLKDERYSEKHAIDEMKQSLEKAKVQVDEDFKKVLNEKEKINAQISLEKEQSRALVAAFEIQKEEYLSIIASLKEGRKMEVGPQADSHVQQSEVQTSPASPNTSRRPNKKGNKKNKGPLKQTEAPKQLETGVDGSLTLLKTEVEVLNRTIFKQTEEMSTYKLAADAANKKLIEAEEKLAETSAKYADQASEVATRYSAEVNLQLDLDAAKLKIDEISAKLEMSSSDMAKYQTIIDKLNVDLRDALNNLSNKQVLCADIKAELDEMKSLYEAEKELNSKLMIEMKSLEEEKVVGNSVEVHKLRNDLQVTTSQYLDLKSSESDLKHQLLLKSQEVSHWIAEAHRLEEEAEEKLNENIQLSEQLSNANAQVQQLEMQLRQQQQSGGSSAELRERDEEISSLIMKYSSLQSKLNNVCEENEQLKQKILELNLSLEEKSNDFYRVQDRLSSYIEEVEEKERVIDSLNADIVDRNEKLQVQENENKELEEKLWDLENSSKGAKAQSCNFQGQVLELQERINQLKNENSSLMDDIENQAHLVDQLETELRQLRNAANLENKEAEYLSKKIEKINEEMEQLKEEKNKVAKESGEKQSKLMKALAKIKQQMNDMSKKDGKIKELEVKVAELEDITEDRNSYIEELNLKIEKAQENYNILSIQNEILLGDQNDLRGDMATLEDLLSEKEEKILKLNGELRSMSESLESSNIVEILRSELQIKDDLLQQHKEKLVAAYDEIEALKTKVLRVEESLEEMKAKNVLLDSEKEDLVFGKKTVENEILILNKKLDVSLRDFEDEIRERDSLIEELRSRVDEVKKEWNSDVEETKIKKKENVNKLFVELEEKYSEISYLNSRLQDSDETPIQVTDSLEYDRGETNDWDDGFIVDEHIQKQESTSYCATIPPNDDGWEDGWQTEDLDVIPEQSILNTFAESTHCPLDIVSSAEQTVSVDKEKGLLREVAFLKKELNTVSSLAIVIKKEKEVLRKEVEEQSEFLKDSTREIESLKNELVNEHEISKKHIAKVEDLQNKIGEITEKLEHSFAEIGSLREEANTMTRVNQNLLAEKDILQKELDETFMRLEDTTSFYEDRLKDITTENARNVQQICSLTSELNSLREKSLSQEESESFGEKQEAGDLEKKFKNVNAKLGKALSLLKERNKTIQDLEERLKTVENLENVVVSLQNQLDHKDKEIQELLAGEVKSKKDLETNCVLEERNKIIHDLESALSTLQMQFEEKDKQIEKLRAEAVIDLTVISERNEKIQDLVITKENFEAAVNTLQIQLDQKDVKIEEMMAKIASCEVTISEKCLIIQDLNDQLRSTECFNDSVAQPQVQSDDKGKEMITKSQEPAGAIMSNQVSGNESDVLTIPAVVLSEFDNDLSPFNETSLTLAEGIGGCAEDELETLRSNVKQWEAWYNEYCQLLMQKDEQIAQLSSDVQWYSNELTKYQSNETESQTVHDESEAAGTCTESAQSVGALKTNSEVNQLLEQLKCANSELALSEATKSSLQQRLEDANDSVKILKSQLQQANLRGDQISLERENIIGMRTRISDLDRASEVLGSQLRRAEHEKSQLEEELAVKNDQIAQLQQSLGVNMAKFELCEEQREEYKRKVDESKQHHIQLEFQLKQLTELLSEREHEAEELRLKLNQSDTHSFASNNVLNQLQEENSDLAIECSQLKEELGHLNRKLEGLEENSTEVNNGDWKKLQNDYQALQQLYKDLEGEKESFKTEYESTLQAYNTLEYQNHDLEKMFEAGESKIISLKEENERLTKDFHELTCEKNIILKESQKVKEENAGLEQQINNLKSVQQDIFASKETEETMKSEIETLKTEIERKEVSLEASETKIKELEETVVTLSENIEKLKTELEEKEEVMSKLEENLKSSADSNIKTVNQLQIEINNLKEKIQNIENLSEERLNKINSLQTELVSFSVTETDKDKIRDLEAKIEINEKGKKDAENEVLKLKEKLSKVEQEKVNLQALCKSLSDDVMLIEEEKYNLEVKLEDIENNLAESKLVREAMEEKTVKLEKEKYDLEAKIADFQKHIAEVKLYTGDLENEKNNLEIKLVSAEDKAGDFEREKIRLEVRLEEILQKINDIDIEEMESLKVKNVELNEKLNGFAEEEMKCKKSLYEKDDVISTLEKKLQDEGLKFKEAKAEIESHKKRIYESDRLMEEAEKNSEEIKKANEELQRKVVELECSSNQYQTNIEAYENERVMLYQQLQEYQTYCAQLEQQYYALQEEFNKKVVEIEEFRKSVEEKNSRISLLEENHSELKIALDRSENEKAQGEQRYNFLQAEAKNFKAVIHQLEDALTNEREIADKLRSEAADLEKQLNNISEQADELRVSQKTLESDLRLSRQSENELKIKLDSELSINKDLQERMDVTSKKLSALQEPKVVQEVVQKSDSSLLRSEMGLEKTYEEKMTTLTNELKQVKLEKAKLLKDLKTNKIRNSAERPNSDAEKAAEAFKAEKESYLQRIDTIEAANEKLIEMKEAQDNEIHRHIVELKKFQTDISILENKVENLEADKSGSEALIRSLENELAIAKSQVASLSSEISQLHSHPALFLNSSDEVNQIQAEREYLQLAVDTLTRERDDLKNTLEEYGDKSAEMDSALRNDGRSQWETIDLSSSPPETGLRQLGDNNLRRQVMYLESQIAAKNAQIVALSTDYDNLKKSIAVKEESSDLARIIEDLQRTETRLKQASEELELSKSQLNELQAELASERSLVERISTDLISKEDVISKLHSDASQYKNFYDLVLKLYIDYASIDPEYDHSSIGIDLLIEELQTTFEDTGRSRSLEKERNRLRMDVERLKESLEKAENDRALSEEELSKVTEEYKNLGQISSQYLQLLQQVTATGIVPSNLIESVGNFDTVPPSKSILPTTEDFDYLQQNNQLLSERVQELTQAVESSEPRLQYAPGLGVSEDNMRHELDEAMRSLHEKDVRLEEFTWEVTKLLEERDTLQMKLSTALRQNMDLQKMASSLGAKSDTGDEMKTLGNKLEELRKLNYNLDIQLRREREDRRRIEQQIMGTSTSSRMQSGLRRSLPHRRLHSVTSPASADLSRGTTPVPSEASDFNLELTFDESQQFGELNDSSRSSSRIQHI